MPPISCSKKRARTHPIPLLKSHQLLHEGDLVDKMWPSTAFKGGTHEKTQHPQGCYRLVILGDSRYVSLGCNKISCIVKNKHKEIVHGQHGISTM